MKTTAAGILFVDLHNILLLTCSPEKWVKPVDVRVQSAKITASVSIDVNTNERVLLVAS